MTSIDSRRGFVAGMGCLIFAPAIVRADSLMPVKSLESKFRFTYAEYRGIIERSAALWLKNGEAHYPSVAEYVEEFIFHHKMNSPYFYKEYRPSIPKHHSLVGDTQGG